MEKLSKFLCSIVVCVLSFWTVSLANGATMSIAPTNTQGVGNCFPFGIGDGSWNPYMGFVYKNIPAFSLQPGDILAFDLGQVNNTNIQLDIAMAPTTVNGGTINAGAFTQVVSNTQTPSNPTGDTIIGNFELRFIVESSFNFPGGGLIIRFSNPSASYALDNSCDGSAVLANSTDTSDFFVERFYRDSDGVSTWDNPDTASIGGFQITTDIVCGDGTLQGAESCDDGNTDNNDGCSSTCAVESGWNCIGEPSVCTTAVTCSIERLLCYDIIATDENSTTNIDYWAVCLDNGGTGTLHSDNAQNTYNLYLFGGGPGWFNTSGDPAVAGNPGWTTWIAHGANESGFLQPIGDGYLLTGVGAHTGNTRYTVQGKKVPCMQADPI
jgi:cysteine-rich repeat protein